MKSSFIGQGDNALASQYNDLRIDGMGAGALAPHAQASPDLTLHVQPGVFRLQGRRIVYAGGDSGSFSVPVTDDRIDLLCIDKAGSLSIVEGTEAGTPAAPTYPADKMVICEVYCRPGMAEIHDEDDDAAEGYISSDQRIFLAVPERRYSHGMSFQNDEDFLISLSGTGAAAEMTLGNGVLLLSSGTDAAGYAFVAKDTSNSGGHNILDYDPDIFVVLVPGTSPGGSNTKKCFANFGDAPTSDAGRGAQKGFGFCIEVANGTYTLYAYNSTTSAYNQVALSVGAIASATVLRCYAKLISGVRIEYYVNGALVHTATTNLPSGDPFTTGRMFKAAMYSAAGTTSWSVEVKVAQVSWNILA